MKIKYLVKDSQGNIMRVFYDWMLAYNYKHVFGHNGWYVEKKKVLMILILALLSSFNVSAQSIVQEGNTFKSVKTEKVNKEPDKQTGYYYEIKGKKYPIYKSSRGSYYIIRTNKNGEEYKDYSLPKELKEKLKRII